jgi:urea transport system ATP-binding protein
MLVLDRVSAAYGKSRVLWDVTLAVGEGEAVTLLGRNGVGKTTLLKSILGLHPLTDGLVIFDDRNVTRLPPYARARLGIAYVPQGRGIFPYLTVQENLQVALAASPGGRRPGGDAVPGFVFELFPVLREMLARKGGYLSGGQQQQLAIARALMSRPRLLLLDEPTEGIQPSLILEIEEALTRIRRELKVAVLLVEQYLEFAWAFAERYYVMQKGRIVRNGNTQGQDSSAAAALLTV